MDKRVIFAVAGSGKTTELVNRLTLDKRVLLVTYTENNYNHLQNSVIRKFGYLPANIRVMSYFTFLYSFCFRPLSPLANGVRGVSFRMPHPSTQKVARTNPAYYRTASGDYYHNRLAKLVNDTMLGGVINRLDRFFDALYVDEVQDFAGHDFNLLVALKAAKIDLLFVGDFFQHTYDTSRDGSTNRTLHDDIDKFEKRFVDTGFVVDKTSLGNSRRCGDAVCSLIRSYLQIDICAYEPRTTIIVPITTEAEAAAIHANPDVVKLFYETHYTYNCYSQNWGASKGQDHYTDVCVVISDKLWKQYQLGSFPDLNPQTRNKLYVALTRTRGNLYLAPAKLFREFKI